MNFAHIMRRVQELREASAGPARPKGHLEAAIEGGDAAPVRRLLPHGAAPQAENQEGRTPLMLAARAGQDEIVEPEAP